MAQTDVRGYSFIEFLEDAGEIDTADEVRLNESVVNEHRFFLK